MKLSSSGQSPAMQATILHEQVGQLYDKLPFAIISNFAISAGLVGMLWVGGVPREILLGWLAGVFVLGVLRWVLQLYFRHRQGAASDPVRWVRLYVVTSLLSGALLGAAGLLFFQHQLLALFALTIVLGIMSIGSIMMHAAYLPAHVAYLLPVILPFSLRCILEFELIYVAVGVFGLLFLPVNLLLARKIQSGLLESIHLRSRNQLLIQELIRQKELAEAAQTRAEQANMAKTRFFAAASHDLRQPVQALELFSATLENELQEHPSRSLVGNIRAVGREFSDLLSALLDFSKIDAAATQPMVRDFPVADLLQRMADDFVPQALAHGLCCRVVMSSAWVRSDPILLERIVRNFMSNAIKYTKKGKILLGCRHQAGDLRIEVHDTGIGIAAHQQKEIFNEFVQLGNPERDRYKGLGLGLAIVDGLARMLKHPLALRSQAQRGSMFAVTVPLGRPGARPAVEAQVMYGQSLDASALLVDDDQSIRLSATRLLENWGYAVVTAESADEALHLLRSTGFQPDVMLVDYRLREGRTGVEAIRLIRDHCGRQVPAAILTGDTDPERLREARESGYPLLHKPLAAGKLRTLLANLLRTQPRAPLLQKP